MKVVAPKEMARIESLAYAQGASEAAFMERAGVGLAHYVEHYVCIHRRQEQVVLLCGKGNNGGDAFVAGRYLLQKGFEVAAIQCSDLKTCSPLCQANGERFLKAGGFLHRFDPQAKVPFPSHGVIVDGLFGTGFKGKVTGSYADCIQQANQSKQPIISVDIPSGLDGATGAAEGACISATETVFLGLPKTGFFLLEGWNHVGQLRHVDFGLPLECIEAAIPDFFLTGQPEWTALLPPMQRNRHKYEAGYVVGLGGSPAMPGAAIMSAFAALRGGAGIIKLLHLEGMEAQLANCPVEVIRVPYQPNQLANPIQLLNSASATFIGPGLGRSPEMQTILRTVLPQLTKPCVIDADALSLLPLLNLRPPTNCILTPHHGEMARLLHLESTPPLTLSFLRDCQNYVQSQNVTLVLKGGPSFILHPGTTIRLSARGSPGMAKAGSGDVLTGLLAALLAQGVKPHDAATLGVALHAIAGEEAVREKTAYCVVAWDILEAFPRAFSRLLSE